MSKSEDHFYLDKNKTILCTATNLGKEALEGFNTTNTLKALQGLTPLVLENYSIARNDLFEALLFGNTNVCAMLSYFNQEGIGGPKSPYNQKLFLVIGSNLGNQKCTAALEKLPNNCNVQQEANIWIACINIVKATLKKLHQGAEITLDTPLTTADLVYAEGTLKSLLLQQRASLDAYNAHINITRSETEVAETFVPPPAPKQANYYDTHHTTATTTTTNIYIPPEQSKQSVKPMGQHPQEKEGCEIC